VTPEDDSSSSSTSKGTEDLMKSRPVPIPAIHLSQDESSSEEKLKVKDGKQKPKDNKAKKEEKMKVVGERVQMREEKVEVKQKDEKVKEVKPKISLEEEKLDEARKKSEKKAEEEEKVKLCLVASYIIHVVHNCMELSPLCSATLCGNWVLMLSQISPLICNGICYIVHIFSDVLGYDTMS
jgi:uncharacterized membrane protein